MAFDSFVVALGEFRDQSLHLFKKGVPKCLRDHVFLASTAVLGRVPEVCPEAPGDSRICAGSTLLLNGYPMHPTSPGTWVIWAFHRRDCETPWTREHMYLGPFEDPKTEIRDFAERVVAFL